MDLSIPSVARAELAAGYLQLAVTLALVLLCVVLQRRYRKPYFALWAAAWWLHALRVGAILAFLQTGISWWLFWHQVMTGWGALALLWAALVFSQRIPWRPVYATLAIFPPVWAYFSLYVVDDFMLAAIPMVAFVVVATGWTAWAFLRYDRLVGSPTAKVLAGLLVVWALHHLDYPFLRARGAWSPWGYYIDAGFLIGMGAGILFLVLEDLDQGLRTLTSLSGELQRRSPEEEPIAEAMLRRALSLRGVHGSALYLASESGGAFVHGAGVAALWPFEGPPEAALRGAERVHRSGLPVVEGEVRSHDAVSGPHPYTAALPVIREEDVVGALVVVGEARDPFTVLDDRFLVAFGQQVGAALENEDLHRNLESRTEELERLQARMIHQHEEERSRLWRELHDETAQVLAALNLHLGVLQERADPEMGGAFEKAKSLVGDGIRSIRSVTRNLRPTALDDLGLSSAMRALARDLLGDSDVTIEFDEGEADVSVGADGELALYRTLQEALSNALRHGQCSRVTVVLATAESAVTLTVHDDGTGLPDGAADNLRSRGGLAGVRERITALGGDFLIGNHPEGGARLQVRVPSLMREQL